MKSAMPFQIKLKKFSDQQVDRASDQLGQELETYPFSAVRSERYFVDGFEDLRSDLEFELSQKIICIETLQQVACKGLRHGGEMRPLVWKILLGYLSVNSNSWEDELTQHRLKYTQLKEEFLASPSQCTNKEEKEYHANGLLRRHEVTNGDHPLNLRNGSTWNQYFKNAEIAEQIDRDLERTHPDIEFFSVNSPISQTNQAAMRNILLLFAKMNPAIGYVQGMNEVLAPLYYVFRTDSSEDNTLHAEADSFGCFVQLLSGFVDNFCPQLDNSSVGIHATLSRLSQLLKANDKDLWDHLENSKVNTQFYAFRWVTLLLTQEFEFHSIMTIWDFLLSNPLGVQEMLLRVCCSMLLCVRNELLQGDFAANLKLLQHYPEVDLRHLLDVASNINSL
ncbi:TBC1 domain family member 13 [Rhynchospora pubera]|uniref:TBC1 domain family member 13 n=1 Tax=Rhynchospora pubera TaxID=906938 RepID=A0AAV8HPI6_9POAL|nr:TBC1 domain family member 13 [Rhynchospora pubera]